MNPQVAMIVGVVLILLSVSFFYKAWLATIRGKVTYWDGFLPLTLISPWTVHLPAGKNSLVKTKEGLWIHCVMSPLFFLSSFLCFVAGMEFCGWPGADICNSALHGGKAGGMPLVLFDKRQGFHFPLLVYGGEKIGKLFSTKVKHKDDNWTTNDGQSYNDAASGSS